MLVVAGQGFNILNVFDTRTWKRVASMQIGNSQLTGIALDEGRLFAVSEGPFRGQNPAGDGAVRVMDRKTYRVLGTIPVGAVAGQVLADARTHHVFVLSGAHLKSPGSWTSASLVTTIDARTGSRLRETRIPTTFAGAMVLDSKHGLIDVISYSINPKTGNGNNLVVLSARTGAIVRSIALPSRPAR